MNCLIKFYIPWKSRNDPFIFQVFSLRRPFSFSSDKVELSMHGGLVSVVRMERTFMKPVCSINDASDRPVLRIKGDMNRNEFQVKLIKETL